MKKSVLYFLIMCFSLLFLTSNVTAGEYFWSDSIVASGSSATGSVEGVGYTITSNNTIESTVGMFNVSSFPDEYKIPGDNGAGAEVTVLKESQGSTYTLTFDRPVEQSSSL